MPTILSNVRIYAFVLLTIASVLHTTSNAQQAQPFLHKAGFEIVEPHQLYGEWASPIQNLENRITIRPDGTYELARIFYAAGKAPVPVVKRTWSIDGRFLVLTDAAAGTEDRVAVEIVSKNQFRLSGGVLGLEAHLYTKLSADGADGFLPQWLIGHWAAGGINIWFYPDGTYDYKAIQLGTNVVTVEISGRWRSDGSSNRLFLAPDGGPVNPAKIVATSYFAMKLETTNNGILALNRQKLLISETASFAGQYVGKNTTTIVRDDMSAVVIFNGERHEASISQKNENQLTVRVPDFQSPFGQFTASPYENLWSLDLTETPLGFAGIVTKQSETTVPNPSDLVGRWINISSLGSNTEYQFYKGDLFIRKSGDFVYSGDYAFDGSALRLGPACVIPFVTSNQVFDNVKTAGNQLVLSGSLSGTFMAVPYSSLSMAARKASIDQREAVENARWKQRIPLGSIIPFNTPVGGELTPDPNPSDVFVGSPVFKNAELYQYTSYNEWVKNIFGQLVSVTAELLNIDPNLGPSLDYNQGSFRDRFSYNFFPNGRMQFRVETYSQPQNLSPVTPKLDVSWTKYRVNGESIEMGALETVQLLLGHRRVKSIDNGVCADHIDFTLSDE